MDTPTKHQKSKRPSKPHGREPPSPVSQEWLDKKPRVTHHPAGRLDGLIGAARSQQRPIPGEGHRGHLVREAAPLVSRGTSPLEGMFLIFWRGPDTPI